MTSVGVKIYKMVEDLYPLCRSLTGIGSQMTLQEIKKEIPIKITKVASGTKVFDWVIPKEWSLHRAYIKNSQGNIIIDTDNHNLHILNYSQPFKGKLKLQDLIPHLHYMKDHPTDIPYLTSYYKETWGFCLSYRDFLNLKDDIYDICIDTSLKDGFLEYGELLIPGKSQKEILLSTYFCHPSTCNDNLSGVCLLTYLAKYLLDRDNYYSYRIIFIPETIGSICYIHNNIDILKSNVIGGYVLTCVGDSGSFTYLMTQDEDSLVDRITKHALRESNVDYKLRSFTECGSDERQFNYPGVNLKIGSLMRTKYGEYPEYHTSADNLHFIKPEFLEDSYQIYLKCLNIFEKNQTYLSATICEPLLGPKGLYPMIGGEKSRSQYFKILRNILYYSNGQRDLLQIAEILKIPVWNIYKIVNDLLNGQVLKQIVV